MLRAQATARRCALRAFSLRGASNQAWMNWKTLASLGRTTDLDSMERMLVTALFVEDAPAASKLSKSIQAAFPQRQWHQDTFGNLLLADGADADHAAVVRLAEKHSVAEWVEGWEAQDSGREWVGGVGGRVAPLARLLEAVLSSAAATESTEARTLTEVPSGALTLIMQLYSSILRCPPSAFAVLQEAQLVPLLTRTHGVVKRYRLLSGSAARGTEDAIMSSAVAAVLTSLASHPSRSQPGLLLLALLPPDELHLGVGVFADQVLPRRAPAAARADVLALLDALCPPRLRTGFAQPLSGTLLGMQEREREITAQRRLAGPGWADLARHEEMASSRARTEAAVFLFRKCLEIDRGEVGRQAPSIVGPLILERMLRVAGLARDGELWEQVMSQLELQRSLGDNAVRRVIAAAFLGLQDWLYSRELGPAEITPTSLREGKGSLTQPAVSVQQASHTDEDDKLPPALLWTSGHAEVRMLLSRLSSLPVVTRSSTQATFASQQADKVCGRHFAVLLADCAHRQKWAQCEGLLEAWLGEYDLGALRPRALYLLTSAFIHTEPLKALRLLEIAHGQHGLEPDTDSLRLLCVRLAKSHGADMAERAWKLAMQIHHRPTKSRSVCALYDHADGYRDAGPSLVSYRCRWLARQGLSGKLRKHLGDCRKQFLRVAKGRKNVAYSMLFPLYHTSIRVLAEEAGDVETAIFLLRELLRLPRARLNGVQMRRTVDIVMNLLLAEDRALRGAALIEELRSYGRDAASAAGGRNSGDDAFEEWENWDARGGDDWSPNH